jgi:large subunit ribosomal protein L15
MMELSTLRGAPGARKRRKRVGRGPGSGHGKTCGRGHKGQKSRAGYSQRPGWEGGQMPLNRRLPKRGFHHQDRHPCAVVNVDALENLFEAGAVVTAEILVKAGLAGEARGGVKVLGRGELTKKLTVRVNQVSASARKKIEAAGGRIELITADVRRPAEVARG